jgi:hypothetical protein
MQKKIGKNQEKNKKNLISVSGSHLEYIQHFVVTLNKPNCTQESFFSNKN